jgi:hypothetical protein
MARAKFPKACGCGCGGMTKGGAYLPGHDSKHKSRLLQEADGISDEAVAARAKLEKSGWATGGKRVMGDAMAEIRTIALRGTQMGVSEADYKDALERIVAVTARPELGLVASTDAEDEQPVEPLINAAVEPTEAYLPGFDVTGTCLDFRFMQKFIYLGREWPSVYGAWLGSRDPTNDELHRGIAGCANQAWLVRKYGKTPIPDGWNGELQLKMSYKAMLASVPEARQLLGSLDPRTAIGCSVEGALGGAISQGAVGRILTEIKKG